MTSVMDLGTLWNEPLASVTTTTDDIAAAFGSHAGSETELAFASALGWLVGPLGAHWGLV